MCADHQTGPQEVIVGFDRHMSERHGKGTSRRQGCWGWGPTTLKAEEDNVGACFCYLMVKKTLYDPRDINDRTKHWCIWQNPKEGLQFSEEHHGLLTADNLRKVLSSLSFNIYS